MNRSLVLTNHKGGVGKSTSATNIAFGLVQLLRHIKAVNSRVLLIDTDSQGHASLVTTGCNDFGADNSLYTVLMADRKDASNVMLDCIVESTWDPDLHVLYLHPRCSKVRNENSPARQVRHTELLTR